MKASYRVFSLGDHKYASRDCVRRAVASFLTELGRDRIIAVALNESENVFFSATVWYWEVTQ